MWENHRTHVSWTIRPRRRVYVQIQRPSKTEKGRFLYFLPMSQQQSTFPSCVEVTRRTMDNRPVRRRRTGAVRHLLLAAAFLACSSQLVVVDANSWWWVTEWSLVVHWCFERYVQGCGGEWKAGELWPPFSSTKGRAAFNRFLEYDFKDVYVKAFHVYLNDWCQV